MLRNLFGVRLITMTEELVSQEYWSTSEPNTGGIRDEL